MSATRFSFEPLFLVLAALAALLYARAARRGRPARWRVVLFSVGLFLIAASLNSPLETIAAHERTVLQPLDHAAFFAALDQPPAATDRLKAAAERHRKTVESR